MTDDEVARRREATLLRMLATPHVPHETFSALRKKRPELSSPAPSREATGGCDAP